MAWKSPDECAELVFTRSAEGRYGIEWRGESDIVRFSEPMIRKFSKGLLGEVFWVGTLALQLIMFDPEGTYYCKRLPEDGEETVPLLRG